jgi:hypothetical protein
MAGLTESYCRSNETSHASQFKWLDNTFNAILNKKGIHLVTLSILRKAKMHIRCCEV